MAKPRPRRSPKCVLVLSSFPTKPSAERVARALVRDRHMACATVSTGNRAFYRWEGTLNADTGALLWGKTTRAHASAAIRALARLHPDRVPEILVLEVRGGHGPYLDWVAAEVGRSGARR